MPYHSDGYKLVHDESHHRASRRRVLEHIVLYEQYHNCCVLELGIIHHIDGNKTNNNVENLRLMSRSEHIRHHRLEERRNINYSSVNCIDCKTNTVPMQNRKSGYSYPYWHKIGDNVFRCHKCYQRHYRNAKK